MLFNKVAPVGGDTGDIFIQRGLLRPRLSAPYSGELSCLSTVAECTPVLRIHTRQACLIFFCFVDCIKMGSHFYILFDVVNIQDRLLFHLQVKAELLCTLVPRLHTIFQTVEYTF